MARSCSIVLEYENASTHDVETVGRVFCALERQFAGRPIRGENERDEVIVTLDTSKQSRDEVDRIVRHVAPRLLDLVDFRTISCPGMRYYELKNAGAATATREIIVLLDSDSVPEDDWLETLLAPFVSRETIAATGHTYLGHDNFLSRVFALVWIFPLRHDSPREIRRRALNANNCAFRRDWFANHTFPSDAGFKTACSLLAAQLRDENVELKKVPAFTRHEPLEGWKFLIWRAAVAGRDDDSRYATLRSSGRGDRVVRACTRWVKQLLRSARRVLLNYKAVGMPIYEILPAIVVAWGYYSITFVAQLRSAVSGPRQEPEHVPDFVIRH